MNRNAVPFDDQPPMVTSGVRTGMAAMTTRGFDEAAARETGKIMVESLTEGADIGRARTEQSSTCSATSRSTSDLEEGYA